MYDVFEVIIRPGLTDFRCLMYEVLGMRFDVFVLFPAGLTVFRCMMYDVLVVILLG